MSLKYCADLPPSHPRPLEWVEDVMGKRPKMLWDGAEYVMGMGPKMLWDAAEDVAPAVREGACGVQPLSSDYGTSKTVRARFWPWLSGKSP